jgi:hypothetical protein
VEVINSTFITLIPNKQDVIAFEGCRPISLCNLIYKRISKIIANILKGVFLGIVSNE